MRCVHVQLTTQRGWFLGVRHGNLMRATRRVQKPPSLWSVSRLVGFQWLPEDSFTYALDGRVLGVELAACTHCRGSVVVCGDERDECFCDEAQLDKQDVGTSKNRPMYACRGRRY
jgi:hypothetical protein